MHAILSFERLRPLAFFTLLLGFASTPSATGQTAPPSPAIEHTPPVSAKINALAHRVLQAGLRSNALNGDELKPWHLKIDYQVRESGLPRLAGGTVEEWYLGANQWRRVSRGDLPYLNGTEWSVSKIERYQSKPEFSHVALNLRVARPVIDPLYQAANIHPDYEMDIKRVNTAGINLNCVSVVNPSRYADEADPAYLFPSMCFDSDLHLRLTSSSDTSVQFEDIQPFQGRAVARDVKVIVKGDLVAEMKVSVLESLSEADTAITTPARDAAPEPYTIEPGFPRPEAVYEVGAHVPLQPNGFPYRGVAVIPIVIHKDGSVKATSEAGPGSIQNLYDALGIAINKWKYKPYLVDGQPVEVGLNVRYDLDAKPFVPSYERPKAAPVATSPEDFSSAYDPKRDPEKDLAMAMASASQSNKRILIEVGGDWCIWCKLLDKFFTENAEVRQARDASFVVMKVNMSALNENYPFLSRFPKIPGYPFLFVLSSDGKLLTPKSTDDLENGSNGYSAKQMKEFLAAWKTK